MIDTHCHLSQISSPQLSSILDSLGSLKLLAVSTTLEDSEQVLCFAEHNQIYPAVGLHPWFLPESQASIKAALGLLESLISDHLQLIKAIGEIGLDYAPKVQVCHTVQREVFAFQLSLAQQYELPVSIHAVKSHSDLQRLLKTYPMVKGTIHGFYGSLELAQSYLKLGYKIGVGPLILRQGTNKLQHVVRALPIQAIVLETDFPNTRQYGVQKPDDLIKVVNKVAEIKQIPATIVESICDQTAKELFSL